MRILSVIGARPQFVKASVVSSRIKRQTMLSEFIVHTGQHYDANMSEVFFRELGIPEPDVNLGIGGGRHGEQTGRMLDALERQMLQVGPDMVLVYGDTNSTMAAALAASKLHIPVAHVESGLRSYNRKMPEEINRVVTDHVSELLFAPTEIAIKNLVKEGIGRENIHLIGDVMYDVAIQYGQAAAERSNILKLSDIAPKRYTLATIHRAENTDIPDRLKGIWRSLELIGRHQPVVVPLHPRTQKMLATMSVDIRAVPGVRVIDPVGYLDMVMLEKNAAVILTDSGGVQKEAYFHRVPCVTLRDETEWVELVNYGYNRLAGTQTERIIAAYEDATAKSLPETADQLYGSGNAAELLADVLVQYATSRQSIER